MDANHAIEFIPYTRNGQLAVLNHYIHRLDRRVVATGTEYYKCVKCKSARAAFENDHLISLRGQHDHPAEAGEVEVMRWKNALKAADALSDPASHVYYEIMLVTSADAGAIMPTYKACSSSIYRSRNRELPDQPVDREQTHLEGRWAQTLAGSNFLLTEDGAQDKIILLGTQQDLEHLCRCQTIYMDGTFKVSPDLFFQVYTIHGEILGDVLPLVIGFLPNKAVDTYERFLFLIERACLEFGYNFDPATVQIVSEVASLRVIQRMFPRANVIGCTFHYGQGVWRKAQNLGFQQAYNTDANYKRWIRRASILPLVPLGHMDQAWQLLVQVALQNKANRHLLHEYLWQTWVDPAGARFPRHLWNHAENFGRRTNNNLEGWHSGIGRKVNRPHPSLYKVVELFQAEQACKPAKKEARIQQLQLGHPPNPRNQRYVGIDGRINRARNRFASGELELAEYMDSLGHLVGKKSLRE